MLMAIPCGSSAAQMAPCGASNIPPTRRGEAVDHAQAGVGQRQSTQQARQRHVLARRDVAPAVISPAQRAADTAQALQAEAVGQGIGADARHKAQSTA